MEERRPPRRRAREEAGVLIARAVDTRAPGLRYFWLGDADGLPLPLPCTLA
jgi:hypothetical protein